MLPCSRETTRETSSPFCLSSDPRHSLSSLQERIDDVARFVLNAGVEDAQSVELIWVDKAGFDVRVTFESGISRAIRVGFSREARKGADFRPWVPGVRACVRSCSWGLAL